MSPTRPQLSLSTLDQLNAVEKVARDNPQHFPPIAVVVWKLEVLRQHRLYVEQRLHYFEGQREVTDVMMAELEAERSKLEGEG